jgi:alpha-amylase/alpha-mannosidase (GH57 family)
MEKHLCIHGHFYQPPREDPWLGTILPEGSAAPSSDWNERITRESYAPMARARRLDGSGRIVEVMNCYEWISFNAGPTLLGWMAKADPDTARLMVEGDKLSVKRLGHGNAIAQVYHHQILPLASQLDKELEVSWAVDDFTARFGRAPEGMWLSEAAVDTDSLEVLAANGVAFTILCPRQAKAVGPVENGRWTPVDQGSLDIRQPYLVKLPSGRSISVFFYDGPLSQAVAFERLLADGENFWRRLEGAAGPGLLSLATDGETYGHHFTFGEMALAFVLDQARRNRGGITLDNYAAYLAANPPTKQVKLHEPSSWSCAHGVERWRSDCGCTDGGHPGWRQDWRGPLRQALQRVKDMADLHFFQRGASCFPDPRAALGDYGKVLAGLWDQDTFAKAHFARQLPAQEQAAAWKLLAMQQWGLASLASCAWFFDEISRIEPVNALTYALRAMELASRTGAPDMEAEIRPILRSARSNLAEYATGEGVFDQLVRPRRETGASLAAQALFTLWAKDELPGPGKTARADWPGVGVSVTAKSAAEGTLNIHWALESGIDEGTYSWTPPAHDGPALPDPLAAPVVVKTQRGEESFIPRSLPVNKRQALADAFAVRASDALWNEGCARMAAGANLVTEIQEAQTTMTLAPRWAGMWAELIWSWLWGVEASGKRQELLLAFIRQSMGGGFERAALMERVRQRACSHIAQPSPDWQGLCRMVRRARELGLPEEWWSVQNLVWDLELHKREGREFAYLIGFAV